LFATVDAMLAKRAQPVDPAGKLSAAIDAATGTTASEVEDIEILVDGDTAFPALVAELDQAHESILYQTFNFFDDEIGDEIVNKLVAAKDRGVLVRVVVDAFGAR